MLTVDRIRSTFWGALLATALASGNTGASPIVKGAIADGHSHKLRSICPDCRSAASLRNRFPHLVAAGLLTSLDDEIDWAAIMETALGLPESGGTLYLGAGTYFIATPTSVHQTLAITNAVNLQGEGGSCDPDYHSERAWRCATVLVSTADAVVLKYHLEPGEPDLSTRGADGRLYRQGITKNRWAVIRDLAVRGAGKLDGSLTNQHGIQIDNLGLVAHNVTVGLMGGNGWYLKASTGSQFFNVLGRHNYLDGLHIEGSSTATNIFGGQFSNNGRDGMQIHTGSWGIAAYGVILERNGYLHDRNGNERATSASGYGILFEDDPNKPTGSIIGCRFYATWDEGNRSGSVKFSDGTLYSRIDYVRFSSGRPEYGHDMERRGNVVSGTDLGTRGPAGRYPEPNGVEEVQALSAIRSPLQFLDGRNRSELADLEAGSLTVRRHVGVGIAKPRSSLHVGGSYAQFPVVRGSPPASDCGSDADAGRIVVRVDDSPGLYLCRGTKGWVLR